MCLVAKLSIRTDNSLKNHEYGCNSIETPYIALFTLPFKRGVKAFDQPCRMRKGKLYYRKKYETRR